jgi:hypothetical protein
MYVPIQKKLTKYFHVNNLTDSLQFGSRKDASISRHYSQKEPFWRMPIPITNNYIW